MEHLAYLMKQLISYEESLDHKLDLLTEIAISSRNIKILKASEEVRDELVRNSEVQKIGNDNLRSHQRPNHISNFEL